MSIAEEILNGETCAECNLPFEHANGFPCLCKECWREKHGRKKGYVDKEGFQCAVYELDSDVAP